jgi:hypothetical protein
MVWECGGPWKAIVGDLIFKRADIVTATHSMFLHPVNGKTRRHTPCQVTYVFCGTVCCIGSCSWNYCKTCFNTRAHENIRKLSERRSGTHMARNRDRRKIRETNEDTCGNVLQPSIYNIRNRCLHCFHQFINLDSKPTKHERSSHFTRVLCKRTVHWADKFELHLFW